ncbi:CDP-alcohol phosphatidyltransferase family protein [Flavobacterium sp. SUN052]|uniref:CDP-alcohol phosphatidyltransferase family protein n=1 Tax=Flavobacterium sp. SUN052 TaxID=3002441 RepID=UPI00237D8324|nr:CDP-alcohol phosphatidyltransferase family protein [Flavobacterium sp. SUN052]MEC4004381.1 CDP-alcohol phosphatidyltransferase family protein [Flavobacterium sp. SUN052]
MNIKKHIPNFLTLLNLFCGCIAIVFISDCRFDLAFYFVCLGIFFDFFDGFFARKFGVSGPLGVQLDSLADMVTSGVAPGFTMVYLLSGKYIHTPIDGYLPYLGFIITLGACYRLANFNIDTRQSDSFIGLPTPANTLFIMSLPLVINECQFLALSEILSAKLVLLAITLLSAYVMNAEIPLFSLKIKNFSVQKYKLQIGFLVASILMIITLQYLAIPLIIMTYVLLSVLNNKLAKK